MIIKLKQPKSELINFKGIKKSYQDKLYLDVDQESEYPLWMPSEYKVKYPDYLPVSKQLNERLREICFEPAIRDVPQFHLKKMECRCQQCFITFYNKYISIFVEI